MSIPLDQSSFLDLLIVCFKWIVSTLAGLFIALLTFLAKKHLDNIDAVKAQLILIQTNLIHLESRMEAKIVHLDNNVKTWKNGNDSLLADIIDLEKKVTNLEKEDIRILSKIENEHR